MDPRILRWIFLLAAPWSTGLPAAQLQLHVVERGNARPVPCRIHLRDDAGQPVRPAALPFWRDHFVCPGKVNLELAPGRYRYEVDRGPEYRLRAGEIEMGGADQSWVLEIERLADLAGEGWWSGELHVHRSLDEIELLMQAEDLHAAPVITWWNNQNLWAGKALPSAVRVCPEVNRCYDMMGGEDERNGGALLYFHLVQPVPITGAGREYPSPIEFLGVARRQAGVWVDIEKPFWWDVPVWLASGQVDSIGIANNHMCRDQMYESEAWGKPRDAVRWPPPGGNGWWTQEIYYQILNCGLRLPPSAGSASGVLPNPVGYNRVYVQLEQAFSWEGWWQGLRAGRSFVSNGPLLRGRANGQWPGHVFVSEDGKAVRIDLDAVLASRDPVPAIEVVQNGRVVRAVPVREGGARMDLGSIEFDASGWFLLRAVAENSKTFRFASTAPFYVEVGAARRRVSKWSAEFFLSWVRERQGLIQLDDPEQRREVLKHHQAAEVFWSGLVKSANAP